MKSSLATATVFLGRTGLALLLGVAMLITALAYSGTAQARLVGDMETLIPSAHLPREATVNVSNNNLDVIEHEGFVYLAWRTSQTHFASSKTIMQVMRRPVAGGTWTFETALRTGKDLREPRLLSLNGELYLYMAELGSNPVAFEPGRTLLVKRSSTGVWSQAQEVFKDGFIPWRIQWHDGRPLMIGYRGGENIYQGDAAKGVTVYVLTTQDGNTWSPAFGGDGSVLKGGVSETDFAFTEQGLVAVGRNEAGDADGWGSKVCRARWSDLATWECKADPRKFDSPLVIKRGNNVYLIGRRQVANGGRYDLGLRLFDFSQQSALYQVAYSLTPKRCAVWKVDEATLSVNWVEDLPSAGDTCFASALQNADGSFDVYNYSNDPVRGAKWPWLKGQLNRTMIYRIRVEMEP